MKTFTRYIASAAMALTFAAFFATSSYAQDAPLANYPILQTASQGTADVASFTEADWKSLRTELTEAIQSDEADVRAEGLQNLIFFATHYGEMADFDRASNELYEVYKLDDNQAHRIMALAALTAIGHEDTMRHVAQGVRTEPDQRVRKLTLAALVEHQKRSQDAL